MKDKSCDWYAGHLTKLCAAHAWARFQGDAADVKISMKPNQHGVQWHFIKSEPEEPELESSSDEEEPGNPTATAASEEMGHDSWSDGETYGPGMHVFGVDY